MTELEQDTHFGHLLVEERKAKKNLACLTSKARQVYDALVPVLVVLYQPHGVDFDSLRRTYEPADGVDIGVLMADIKKAVNRTSVLRKEIEAIEATGV